MFETRLELETRRTRRRHREKGGKPIDHSSRLRALARITIVAFLRVLCACSLFSVFPLWAFDPVVPGKALEFPRDRGAHLGHRIEWWYVTGHLEGSLGFQVTFFRVRNPEAEGNPSRFAPSQLLFAHAAFADPAEGKLLHGQKSARLLPGLVEAGTADTAVRIDDWMLAREGQVYRTRVATTDFVLELELAPTQAPLLQGDRGFSRKGPSMEHASYYYSEPQLKVGGRVIVHGQPRAVAGVAWLDHEWSSELLAAEATGWDWLGVNLDDGGALMAFRIRDKEGRTLWSNATEKGEVAFTPTRTWKSPRTGIAYPVAMDVRVGASRWQVEPIMDDQELDARASTGTLYWEGAVRVRSAEGRKGRGYLELTGYSDRVPF
jgi:predicted secreted hydrolase